MEGMDDLGMIGALLHMDTRENPDGIPHAVSDVIPVINETWRLMQAPTYAGKPIRVNLKYLFT
jgi:hypothetical protein